MFNTNDHHIGPLYVMVCSNLNSSKGFLVLSEEYEQIWRRTIKCLFKYLLYKSITKQDENKRKTNDPNNPNSQGVFSRKAESRRRSAMNLRSRSI